jgi:polar amino acid transport system substrate-binding protein
MKITHRRLVPFVALGVLAATALTGCSTASSSTASSSTSAPATSSFSITTKKLASASDTSYLPSSVKSSGTLNVASSDGNAPWVFFSASGKAEGVDADLINAAGKVLGVKVDWSNIQFTAGIPGIQSGRYDFYLSAMADTKAREQLVDFVDYSKEGSGVIVQKGNPEKIKTLNDLCGKKVSIITGSLFPATIAQLNKTCSSPIQTTEFADANGPLLAVASGQSDATMNTYGVSNYDLRTATSGVQTKLELSPVPLFAPAYQGIAFDKSNSQLAASIAGALQTLVKDGQYAKIMKKWDVEGGSLKNIEFNNPLF